MPIASNEGHWLSVPGGVAVVESPGNRPGFEPRGGSCAMRYVCPSPHHRSECKTQAKLSDSSIEIPNPPLLNPKRTRLQSLDREPKLSSQRRGSPKFSMLELPSRLP